MRARWSVPVFASLVGVMLATTMLGLLAQDKGQGDQKKGKGGDEIGQPDSVFAMMALASQNLEAAEASQSPELMVAAAMIYRRLAKISIKWDPIAITPKDKEGKDILEKGETALDFATLAKDAFDAAELDAAKWKIKDLDKFIKAAKLIEVEGKHELLAGLKTITRTIAPGQWQTYAVQVYCARFFAFGFTANKRLDFTVVRTDIDHVWANRSAMSYSDGGTPGGKLGQIAPFSIGLHNPHTKPAQYTLFYK